MKRLMIYVLSALMLLAIAAPAAATEPEAAPAKVLLDHVGAVAKTFSKGDAVTVVGEQEDCYVLEDGLLVEKWLVRPEGEASPKERTVYAKKGAAVYAGVYCEGEPLLTLGKNQSLTLLDRFSRVMYVRAEDNGAEVLGYLLVDDTFDSKSNGGGSGNGGGSSDGNDGGDISLTGAVRSRSMGVSRLGLVTRKGVETQPYTGAATIVADGVEAYYSFLSRGDEVLVTEAGEETCTISLADGNTAAIPAALLAFEDAAYETWTGYATSNAPFYGNWRISITEPRKLKTNTELSILSSFADGAYYIAQLEGQVGLIPAAKVSQKKIQSSGGSSPEWTDPVL